MVELILENFNEYPEFLKTLSGEIAKMLQSEDWRIKYAGIMTLSQIGEHIESLDDLAPVLMVIFDFVKQDNAAIKAACFHCLGQFCVDNKPDFQIRYCNELFVTCGMGLEDKVSSTNDQTQRVRAYACSCLTNLLQDSNWEIVKPFSDAILDKLVKIVTEDSIFVAKTAVSAISSFSIATNFNSSKYFRKIFGALVTSFKLKHQQSITLSCRLLEAVSIAAFYSEESDFRESLEDIKYIFRYFESVIPNLEDQRVSYLIKGWHRLVSRLKQNSDHFTEYLCSIMVKVLSQCDQYKYAVV